MAKKPATSGEPWRSAEVRQLKTEIKQYTPTLLMALEQRHTPSSVQSRANDLGLSTTRFNPSQYGTKGKRGS